jgi:hypothetical protein
MASRITSFEGNSISMKLRLDNTQISGLEFLQIVRSDSRGNARLLEPREEAKAYFPPLDITPDQLSRSCLKKVNMTIKILSQEKLNTEDKTPHNSPVVGKRLLEH